MGPNYHLLSEQKNPQVIFLSLLYFFNNFNQSCLKKIHSGLYYLNCSHILLFKSASLMCIFHLLTNKMDNFKLHFLRCHSANPPPPPHAHTTTHHHHHNSTHDSCSLPVTTHSPLFFVGVTIILVPADIPTLTYAQWLRTSEN